MQAAGKSRSDRGRALSLFCALSLFLSAIEYLFPRPLPFFRVGLSNLPLILGVGFMDLPALLVLACVKTLGQGILSGSLLSYVSLFSLAGGLASLLAMRPLARVPRLASPLGIAAAGALASNLAQLALARVFVFGEGVVFIAPALLAIGTISGCLLGLYAAAFKSSSRWYRAVTAFWPATAKAGAIGDTASGAVPGDTAADAASPVTDPDRRERPPEEVHGRPAKNRRSRRKPRPDRFARLFSPNARAIVGLILTTALLALSAFTGGMPGAFVEPAFFLVALTLAFLSGNPPRPLPTLILIVSVSVCSLVVPRGLVLFSVGSFPVSLESLVEGLDRSCLLLALSCISAFSVRPGIRIPGKAGAFLASVFSNLESFRLGASRLSARHPLASLDALLMENLAGNVDSGRKGDAGIH